MILVVIFLNIIIQLQVCQSQNVQNITTNQFQLAKRQLIQCHSFCQTCDGPSFVECLSCNNEKYFLSFNKQCITCLSGQYGDNKKQQCLNCVKHCLVCIGPTVDDCKSCNISESYQSKFNSSCISCLEGEYGDSFNQLCKFCDKTCKTCKGPGNNDCLTCYEDYIYSEKGSLCAYKKIIEIPYNMPPNIQPFIQVPSIYLPTITSYSFSLWFRFSYYDPIQMKIDVTRNNNLGIAGITELDKYCYDNQHQSKTLSVIYSQYLQEYPKYLFYTYDFNNGDYLNQKSMNFDKEIHDSEWNWIYFGYSQTLLEAYAFSYFSKNEQIKQLKWSNVKHSTVIPNLKFLLGLCGDDPAALSANGLYYDIRFRYDNLSYMNNQNDLQQYMDYFIQHPKPIKPNYTQLQLFCGQIEVKYSDQKVKEYYYYDQFRGADEYAIFGWMKLVKFPQRGPWHIVFRIQINLNNPPVDFVNFGDRVICCWVGRNANTQEHIHLTSYNYKLQSGGQVNNESFDLIKLDDFNMYEWIFVYYGYSFEKKMAHALLKLIDEEKRWTYYEQWHFKPKYIAIYLGKDQLFPAFNGYLKDWEFAVGEGAFKFW